MQFKNASLTHVGRVRSANEDFHADAPTVNGHVFVVCDGMGGHVGGATASHVAVSSILEYFQREKHENIIQAIDRSLVFANEQVYARSISDPSLKGMGTTATVLVIQGEECFIGHVGDSRIYLKSDNQLFRLTKDHSFVQTLVDARVISDEDAESHPQKNQILKAIGISSSLEPTICPQPILVKQGDVFMLCSDGLNGMVNDRTMEMMVDFQDLSLTATNLVNAALEAGGHDNVTVTLVGIHESSHKKSTFKHFNPIDHKKTQEFPQTSVNKKKPAKTVLWVATSLVLMVLIGVGLWLIYQNKSDGQYVMPKEGKKLTQDDLDRFPAEQISSIKEFEIGLDNGEYFASNYVFKVTVKEGKVTHYWDTPKEERIAEQQRKDDEKKKKKRTEQTNKEPDEYTKAIDEGWTETAPPSGEEDNFERKTVKDKNGRDVVLYKKKPQQVETKDEVKEAKDKGWSENLPPSGEEDNFERKTVKDQSGQDVTLYRKKKKSENSTCTYLHEVKSGETLNKIADILNSTTKCNRLNADKIKKQNRLPNSRINPGKVLSGTCDCDKL
jgi:serine/threonine protein phosphatase PrpC